MAIEETRIDRIDLDISRRLSIGVDEVILLKLDTEESSPQEYAEIATFTGGWNCEYNDKDFNFYLEMVSDDENPIEDIIQAVAFSFSGEVYKILPDGTFKPFNTHKMRWKFKLYRTGEAFPVETESMFLTGDGFILTSGDGFTLIEG